MRTLRDEDAELTPRIGKNGWGDEGYGTPELRYLLKGFTLNVYPTVDTRACVSRSHL